MLDETSPQLPARSGRDDAGLYRTSRRLYADIRALDRALVQADLSAARAAFERMQQDSPVIAEAVSRHPFPTEPRPSRALQTLARCLLQGNLTGARRAFELFS
ncbi:hypothetical protein ESB00_01025 [Oleiharenicola lentus]|uniref:Bacterial transcriptional activator domain-containing protein n=1 Tax=Oleiharenicola lentus TaxID=2508720 RepID=A0A4Q1C6L5_9BACT|nr:hypothetical protein [Oleiharenicola lentus]RXK54513.1 hypothetical protein ESB00_01025 [Oleiharenicola lentus]